jgi:hypothetical protein
MKARYALRRGCMSTAWDIIGDRTMFKLSQNRDTIGITQMGEFEVAPALIVRRFGLPAKGDGYKVSGEYVFEDLHGNLFVVHDWKSTSLWDSNFPEPEDFWATVEPVELSISTHDLETEEFKQWLLQQL